MHRALLIDSEEAHATALAACLHRHGVSVDTVPGVPTAIARLRRRTDGYDIVIVNATDARQPWVSNIRKLQESCRQPGFLYTPLFLLVSAVRREPQFELQLERAGARYVVER
jgi:CheY-like chemotaxis protein